MQKREEGEKDITYFVFQPGGRMRDAGAYVHTYMHTLIQTRSQPNWPQETGGEMKLQRVNLG